MTPLLWFFAGIAAVIVTVGIWFLSLVIRDAIYNNVTPRHEISEWELDERKSLIAAMAIGVLDARYARIVKTPFSAVFVLRSRDGKNRFIRDNDMRMLGRTRARIIGPTVKEIDETFGKAIDRLVERGVIRVEKEDSVD